MNYFLLLLPFAAWLAGEVVWRLGRSEGVTAGRLFVLQVACFVPALVGAKLFSLFERGWESVGLTAELAGGWRFPGGILGLVVGVPLLQRTILPAISLARYADLLSVGIAFAGALMRVGCFLNGCCTGPVCSNWFCLSYPAGSETWQRHIDAGLVGSWAEQSLAAVPLHFLLMAASLAVGLLLLRIDRYRTYDGQVFLSFLMLHEGAKFGLEFLRYPRVEAVQTASLMAVLAGLFGFAFVAVRSRRLDAAQ
jgi:phosphatidylglycerol---prolipoprotein diacylglyceryl transferase